jgi:hypothetical protein
VATRAERDGTRRGRDRLHAALVRDVVAAGLPPTPGPGPVVTEDDLAGLPATVRRYLDFMGVPGRRAVRSLEVAVRGRFRRTPDEAWLPMRAWQHDVATPLTRLFAMRLSFRGLPMLGHDTYVRGRGRMHGKLLGLVTVADGTGDEFDASELVTYLNDAVLLAPSMLLGAPTQWAAVDDRTFDVSLTDAGRTVTARVLLDDRGAPVDFSTTDRYAALPGGPVRAEWRTPVPGWDQVDGRPFPRPGGATWLLDDGPFTYVEGGFVPGTLRCDVDPRAAT